MKKLGADGDNSASLDGLYLQQSFCPPISGSMSSNCRPAGCPASKDFSQATVVDVLQTKVVYGWFETVFCHDTDTYTMKVLMAW